MAYLDTAGAFETDINRGVLHYRSKRLDAVVLAINEYVKAPDLNKLDTVERTLARWKKEDPKEFANRGRPIERQLWRDIAVKRPPDWGWGVPRLVDAGSHPVYEPARWNDNSVVQWSTNCYAYACNDAMNHKAMEKPQPGQLGGASVQVAEESAVRYAVMRDDLTRGRKQMSRLIPLVRLRGEAVPDAVNTPGYYLIALITAPNADYHWVRQDRNGLWSHKPGWGLATDRDSNGQLIFDPRDATIVIPVGAALVKYEFTTFYYAPAGGVRTGDLGRLPARRKSL